MGRKYTATDGKHISHLGVRTLVGTTTEGYNCQIDFEVAEVTKPLASFSKITKAGHRIILDNDVGQGGYIENTRTGAKTHMEVNQVTGGFQFDLWLKPQQANVWSKLAISIQNRYAALAAVSEEKINSESDFQR